MKPAGATLEPARDELPAPPSSRGPIYRVATGCTVQPLDVGTRHEAYLVTAPDGKRYQTGRGLHDILLLVDGRRTLGEICDLLSKRSGAELDPETTVAPALAMAVNAGLVVPAHVDESSEEAIARKERREAVSLNLNPLTLNPLRMTVPVLPQRVIAPLASFGSHLFRPLPFALGWLFAAVPFVLFLKDYGRFAEDVRLHRITGYQYVIAYLLAMLSVLVHELGHASAASRFSARTGTIGVGLYLVFPAFFADVSDVWRLRSRQRLLVDVGGIYFQLLVGGAYYWMYQSTGERVFVWAVLAILVMVAFSLNPLFKFDGYWILSDALGIPNMRRRAGEALSTFLRDMLVTAESREPRSRLLSMGRTRYGFFFGYAIISQVFLIAILYLIFKLFPFLVLDYPGFLIESLREAWTGIREGDLSAVGSKAFGLFFRTLFLLGILLTLQRWGSNTMRLVRRAIGNLQAMSPRLRFLAWRARARADRATEPPPRRVSSYALLLAAGLLLAFCGLFLTAFVHESAHLVVGTLLGGTPAGISCQPVGRSLTYVLFEPGASRFALALYYLAGAVTAGALGLCGILWCERRPAGLVSWSAAVVSAHLLLSSLAYLFVGAIERSGDMGRIGAEVGFPLLGAAILFGTCLFFALFLSGRILLERLAGLVRVDTALDRLAALAAAVVVPLAVVWAGLAPLAGEERPPAPVHGLVGLLVVVAFWSLAFRARTRPAAPVRREHGLALLGLTAGALASWLGVFPPARPILHLSLPPEHRVQAVNLELAVEEDGSLIAEVQMQPFPAEDEVLWMRVRERAPSSWKAYDEFAGWILSGLDPGLSWSLEEHRFDPERAFYRERQHRGARVVRAVGKFATAPQGPATLRLDDAWRKSGRGYVDRIRLELPAGWDLTDVEAEPRDHSAWISTDRKFFVLRNSDERAPESLSLTLEHRAARGTQSGS